MTCVLGLIEDGKAWMGADSATVWDTGTNPTRLSIDANPKVFRVGQFLVGSSGSGRPQRVLRHAWTPPPRRKMTIEKYVATAVVDSIRRVMMESAAASKKENVESVGGDILLGYRGHIFRIEGDNYSIDEPRDPYDAVGCGASAGLGALQGLMRRPRGAAILPVKQRLIEALRIAERLNWAVRGPFVIEGPL